MDEDKPQHGLGISNDSGQGQQVERTEDQGERTHQYQETYNTNLEVPLSPV